MTRQSGAWHPSNVLGFKINVGVAVTVVFVLNIQYRRTDQRIESIVGLASWPPCLPHTCQDCRCAPARAPRAPARALVRALAVPLRAFVHELLQLMLLMRLPLLLLA